MKYILNLVICIVCSTLMIAAQTDQPGKSSETKLYSKKGIYILPEKGDIALRVDAWSFLTYMGGVLSLTGEDSPYWNYGNKMLGWGVSGKYMLESDLAIRGAFRLNVYSDKDVWVVPKSTLIYDPYRPEFVEDSRTMKRTTTSLALGIEKSRGIGRVQGYYGAEVLFRGYKVDTTYKYGNSITTEFNTPDVHDGYVYDSYDRRLLEWRYEKGRDLGLRAFLGVEYFFSPKISLNAEFGYNLMYTWKPNNFQVYEYWDANRSQVSHMNKQVNTGSGSVSNFSLGIDNMAGSLNLLFYF